MIMQLAHIFLNIISQCDHYILQQVMPTLQSENRYTWDLGKKLSKITTKNHQKISKIYDNEMIIKKRCKVPQLKQEKRVKDQNSVENQIKIQQFYHNVMFMDYVDLDTFFIKIQKFYSNLKQIFKYKYVNRKPLQLSGEILRLL